MCWKTMIPRNSVKLCQIFKRITKWLLIIIFHIGYFTYYAFTIYFSYDKTWFLTLITIILVLNIIINVAKLFKKFKHGEKERQDHNTTFCATLEQTRLFIQLKKSLTTIFKSRVFNLILLLITINYLIIGKINSLKKLKSLFFSFILLFVSYFTSSNPSKVHWSSINKWFLVQIIISDLTLNTNYGYRVAKFLYKCLAKLGFTYPAKGSAVVYGNPTFLLHPNAMFVTCSFTFLGCVISLVYWAIKPMRCLENFNAKRLSSSFLMLVLCLFYGIAGSFAHGFSTFYGMKLENLVKTLFTFISASPIICFINYPYKENYQQRNFLDNINSEFSKEIFKEIDSMQMIEKMRSRRNKKRNNFFEYAAKGATLTFQYIWLMMSIFIAWGSIYSFFDQTLIWLAHRVNIKTDITKLGGLLFRPLVYMSGVEWENCCLGGELVAERVFGVTQMAVKRLGSLSLMHQIAGSEIFSLTFLTVGFCTVIWYCIVLILVKLFLENTLGNILKLVSRNIWIINIITFYNTSMSFVLKNDASFFDKPRGAGFRDIIVWGLMSSIPKYEALMNMVSE